MNRFNSAVALFIYGAIHHYLGSVTLLLLILLSFISREKVPVSEVLTSFLLGYLFAIAPLSFTSESYTFMPVQWKWYMATMALAH